MSQFDYYPLKGSGVAYGIAFQTTVGLMLDITRKEKRLILVIFNAVVLFGNAPEELIKQTGKP